MISIRTATNELDRMEELLRAVTEVHRHGIRSTADYAVEISPAGADDFRKHLQTLQRQAAAAATPEEWKIVQSCFRGELRGYHEKTAGELEHLRREIKAATEAVHQFAESLTLSDSDHEARIKEALTRLEALSYATDLEALRAGVREIAGSISESIEVMQRRHKAGIAQLRDEIRVLHKQGERGGNLVDHGTGVWSREKLDVRIAELVSEDQPFCLLLVYIRNLKHLTPCYSRGIVETCQKSLLQRLAEMLGQEAMIGRWDDNSFAAILEIPAPAALHLSRTATQNLSGSYSVQENGLAHNITLVAVAGVIDRTAGADEGAYQKKLLQMSEALAGA